jgi:hypothetical protein
MVTLTDVAIPLAIGLVTGGLFWFLDRRYRVGAQKQKIKQINEDIKNLILREMIRSGRNFECSDIENIIRAQSSIENISSELLKPPSTIMNELYYKVLENEYLHPTFKTNLLKKIKEIGKKTKIRKVEKGEIELPLSKITIVLTVGVAILTMLISLGISLRQVSFPISDNVFTTTIIIIPIIFAIMLFLRRFLFRYSD